MPYPEFLLWLEYIRLERGGSAGKGDARPTPSKGAVSSPWQVMMANFRRLTGGLRAE